MERHGDAPGQAAGKVRQASTDSDSRAAAAALEFSRLMGTRGAAG
jgi:hypothetical protein